MISNKLAAVKGSETNAAVVIRNMLVCASFKGMPFPRGVGAFIFFFFPFHFGEDDDINHWPFSFTPLNWP